MYSNGEAFEINAGERLPQKVWQRIEVEQEKRVKQGKRFIGCICPKCASRHFVYMLWTGRGVPRKYCGNCKPLVSGYDESALYEASVSAPGHSNKRGRRYEGE